jgi:hypothetical protein
MRVRSNNCFDTTIHCILSTIQPPVQLAAQPRTCRTPDTTEFTARCRPLSFAPLPPPEQPALSVSFTQLMVFSSRPDAPSAEYQLPALAGIRTNVRSISAARVYAGDTHWENNNPMAHLSGRKLGRLKGCHEKPTENAAGPFGPSGCCR